MKKIILALSIVSFLTACADLRTKVSIENPNIKKARTLLKEMGVSHGIENWKNISTYTVQFEDEFYGKFAKRATPFPQIKTSFEAQYIPGSFDGRLRITSGDWKNEIWGIQAWKTYVINASNKVEFKKHKDAYFWLPTYQYFIEFPLRIQEATAISYAGEKTINGKICDGVLASWNTTKPQRKIDQYLLWIDRETKRIYKLEYTIREVYTFLKGELIFKDYKNYNGIYLPSIMPVGSSLVKDGLLHEMRINDFKTNQVTIDELRPNKEMTPFGDEKP